MTKAATVVRYNDKLRDALQVAADLAERAKKASVVDRGDWTNQNVVFAKALEDMMPVAKSILLGALQRDECRGAHFKPDFAPPGITASDPGEKRRQAEAWCDNFEANNRQWLKTTVATCSVHGDPVLTYEDVDTTLVPPRPRLYGLVGAEAIEEVWKERARKKNQTPPPDTVVASM